MGSAASRAAREIPLREELRKVNNARAGDPGGAEIAMLLRWAENSTPQVLRIP